MDVSAYPSSTGPISGGTSDRSHSFPQYLLCDDLIFLLYQVRDFLRKSCFLSSVTGPALNSLLPPRLGCVRVPSACGQRPSPNTASRLLQDPASEAAREPRALPRVLRSSGPGETQQESSPAHSRGPGLCSLSEWPLYKLTEASILWHKNSSVEGVPIT